MSRSLILILCFTLLSFGVTVTTDAQTTVYNNFGAGHSGWDYNYGLGWTVSGENVPSQYGVEQAMSFRATASGTVSDIWVAMWYVPFEPQVDVVTVRLAKNPNGQPPLPQDVLEEWTITEFEDWSQWNEPQHLRGTSRSRHLLPGRWTIGFLVS